MKKWWSSVALVLAVALMVPLSAQDAVEGINGNGPTEAAEEADTPSLLDLSGSWKTHLGEGSVSFSSRSSTAAGDRYSISFVANGKTNSGSATFDGKSLRISEAPAAEEAPREAVSSTGVTGALSAATDSPTVEGDSSSTAAPPAEAGPEGPVHRSGSYLFKEKTVAESRYGENMPFVIFEASSPVAADSLSPVKSFARIALTLTISGKDSIRPGKRRILTATVSPKIKGSYQFTTDSEALKLRRWGGRRVLVTGQENNAGAETAAVKVTFTPKTLKASYEASHELTLTRPVQQAKVVALTFNSDHGVITDYDRDWRSGGKLYPEPEWTAKAQHPISHTMDSPVSVTLTIEAEPKGAKETEITLIGSGGGLRFEKKITLKGGKNEVSLDSGDTKLPKKIQALNLSLSFKAKDGPVKFAKVTTQTEVLVTFGKPLTPARNPGFTIKRMRKAIESTSLENSLDPMTITKSVIHRWGRFNLQVAYRNAWELGDDKKEPSGRLVGADCQTIVRYTENAIQMAGVPGETDFVVVWCKVKTPTKGEVSVGASPNVTSPRQYWSDHRPSDSKKNRWFAVLVDGDGGLNRYEAALRYVYKGKKIFFPGGVRALLKSPDEVIDVFTTLSWVGPNEETQKYEVKEHIHSY